MGKNKLKKFAEMETFSCVFQYPFGKLKEESFPLKGRWGAEYFGNENPIVLELGCGKGEYTVGLAASNRDKNFIGIDIKGARIWKGAKEATMAEMKNVAFVRTGIELLPSFFAADEVSEIWITFPDPQMQKVRKRLVSARFLTLYQQVLKDGGEIHLKTDSPFLYEFSCRLVDSNNLPTEERSDDLYGSGMVDEAKAIKTFYEQQWLSRGKKIKLLSFRLPKTAALTDPEEEDIRRDDYHSYPRGIVQEMPDQIAKLLKK